MVTVIYTALKIRIFSTVLYHCAEYISLIESLCQSIIKNLQDFFMFLVLWDIIPLFLLCFMVFGFFFQFD